jgi:hypothetical protein
MQNAKFQPPKEVPVAREPKPPRTDWPGFTELPEARLWATMRW